MRDSSTPTVRPPRSFGLFNAVLTFLFAVLLLVSALFVYQQRETRIRSEITRIGQYVARDLAETLRVSVESLRSAANFIVFSPSISYVRFLDLTAQSFDADPGLLFIEWQPVVLAEERKDFEERARRSGIPDYRLWEPDESGNPIPARERREHVPVLFMNTSVESADSMSTLGLDLAWSPERMRSKWTARDSGRAMASELFAVVTAPDSDIQPMGFAITAPVYERGYAPDSVALRQAELKGYIAGVYALEEILLARFEDLLRSGISLELHDWDHGLAKGARKLTLETSETSRFESEIELELYGGRYHLVITASEGFVKEQFSVLWLTLPSAVLFFGLLTFLFLRRLERGHLLYADTQGKLEAANRQLQELSRHDPLTNAYKRRAFEEHIRQEIHRVDRGQASGSLLILDVDHFKAINDAWGHASGDAILKAIAARCARSTRNLDSFARLGGEEFAIVMSHTNRDEAMGFAERLRRRIGDEPFFLDEHQTEITVTVSIGISTIEEKLAPERWFEQADKALYLAKNSGRNCVRAFD